MSEQHPHRADWLREALDRYEGPLLRYAVRFTGNVEEARDVVQDTFVKLCTADRARVDDHLAPWLFTVCRNRALDIRRKERRMNPLTEDQAQTLASADPVPSATAEHRDEYRRVIRALDTLPKKHQEVIRLKFQEELSYKEISEVTGLTVSNVGYILHTAIKNLQQRLRDNAESETDGGVFSKPSPERA